MGPNFFSDPEADVMEKKFKLARITVHLDTKGNSIVVLSRNAMKILLSLDNIGKTPEELCVELLTVPSIGSQSISELIAKEYAQATESLIGRRRKNHQTEPPFTFVSLTKKGYQVQQGINRNRIMVLLEEEQ